MWQTHIPVNIYRYAHAHAPWSSKDLNCTKEPKFGTFSNTSRIKNIIVFCCPGDYNAEIRFSVAHLRRGIKQFG